MWSISALAQVRQTTRYELEKKNTDDYFTVLPAGEHGAIIFRDTDEYEKGDVWQVIALDTTLTQRWDIRFTMESKFIFKGYDLKREALYLLFRESEHPKSDYQLVQVALDTGAVKRHNIPNEIALELSHLMMLDDQLVLAGYVSYSPTVVSYKFGSEKIAVIPGFFKDRSDIVDLKANKNGTFNVVTLEKDYAGHFLRLRTYSNDGVILFEREVESGADYRFLGAKCSGFIDGNILIAGTYGMPGSHYAVGIYFAIVKPEGQRNTLKYHSFVDFKHFFDYMGEKRAARLRAKSQRKLQQGKEFHYSSRLLLHEINESNGHYLLAAEVYDPEYIVQTRPQYPGMTPTPDYELRGRANSRYAKQPSRLTHVDDAATFEYRQSVVFKINKAGELVWDESFAIDDVETLSLEQVVQLTETSRGIHMVYKTDEDLHYKLVSADSVVAMKVLPVKLKYANDEIRHTFEGVGRSESWYSNHFLIWGYHKVEDGNSGERRNVLYINKVLVE